MLDSVSKPAHAPYWSHCDNGRLQCDLCPRYCRLQDGQRGLCYVRGRRGNAITLLDYGKSSGFCVDPIEKKPLNHYYPGTPVLSFGTAGCNLACKFCQNWDISKSRENDRLSSHAEPEQIADRAAGLGCRHVAYTYNDPVIFHEYAIDVAQACHERGINSVAVTAGYVCAEPRTEFYRYMDAANVDLKAFTDRFYYKLCGGRLAPVLDTLQYIYHETAVWLEITTLLIPGENDSPAEVEQLSRWIADELGVDVPLHFTAFHPDWKLTDRPPTPRATLLRAREVARKNSLQFVYVGNVHDAPASSTWCPACGELLIERDWYQLSRWGLDASGHCGGCGVAIPGCFEAEPGRWGPRRLPVSLVTGQ